MPFTPLLLRRGLVLVAALFLAFSLCSGLPAQEAAPDAGGAPADSTAAAKPPEAVTVPQLLAQGGFVMWFLGAASICLVWFTVEGLFTLRKGKLAPAALVARLRDAITSGNFQEAWNICKANRCFVSAVVGAGLERIGRSKDAVEFIVEETALREANDLKTNTTYLSVIGVVSPMIGLTGTVWGMIGAFRALGLVVAVPAFIAFYYLRARSQSAILHAESEVYRLLDDIPYEQVAGVKIGENFSAEPIGTKSGTTTRAEVSQKVSRAVTTNCPACNAPIRVGTTPCPNCNTVLDWGG